MCVCHTLFLRALRVLDFCKAAGHPPAQWRMANEEATKLRAANVPAELLHTLFSFRFASHMVLSPKPSPFYLLTYSVKC